MKTTSKLILETVHLAVFLPNALIVLLEIYSNDLFLKEEMVIGLMYYLQKQNTIIIE